MAGSTSVINMNSPFLDAAHWDAEVAKMIKSFGAPIDPADAKTIGLISNRITGSELFSVQDEM